MAGRRPVAWALVLGAWLPGAAGAGSSGREHAAEPALRPGVLADEHRGLRAERVVPVREPRLERAYVRVRPPGAPTFSLARRRLSRRGARPELHVYRRHQPTPGLHRRHPTGQS